MAKAPEKKISVNRHASQCAICKHPRRSDIELDYLHCIPWRTICARYSGIEDPQIQRHALALGLNKKRDRKSFYWHIIENAPVFNDKKMTVENAIEAAKQLDRIERVIVDNPTPSNIQVVYNWGKQVGADTGNADNKNRLQSAADPVKVPSLREEIPAL